MPKFPALPRTQGAEPRCVAHLAFAEILVIWALRRFASARRPQEARVEMIAGEFSRAFGLAVLEDALSAFEAVAGSLVTAARLPQAISPVEDDRINATEEALLGVLAAFQQGERRRARALGEWCLLPQGRARFLDGAESLALCLAEAGHRIPYTAPLRPGLMLKRSPEREDLLPSVKNLADLTAPERGAVTALRLWVSAYRQNADAQGAVRRHFERQFNSCEEGTQRLRGDRQGGEDAGLSLHAILRNTTLAASRPVDVRCPACPELSPDEARLLEALAWLQRDCAGPANLALGDWLPPAALRLTMKAAGGLARHLLMAEQPVPLRDWDFAEMASAQEPPQRPAATAEPAAMPHRLSPTLH
jgi:hypothetical protein